MEGIQRLIADNRIVEPVSSLYKDEVREVGRSLGLPEELVERHPFPGPGLAIRCLCSETDLPAEKIDEGWILPVNSVGVQGDSRSYRPVVAVERGRTDGDLHELATRLINRVDGVNRVIAAVRAHALLAEVRVFSSELSASRLSLLRCADAIVRRHTHDSGFDRKVWQFPVILIPVGIAGRPDSIVLRPVHSVDGMTAQSVPMDEPLLEAIAAEILALDGIYGVFHDLTHKPPGTIEWE